MYNFLSLSLLDRAAERCQKPLLPKTKLLYKKNLQYDVSDENEEQRKPAFMVNFLYISKKN